MSPHLTRSSASKARDYLDVASDDVSDEAYDVIGDDHSPHDAVPGERLRVPAVTAASTHSASGLTVEDKISYFKRKEAEVAQKRAAQHATIRRVDAYPPRPSQPRPTE